MKIKNVLLIIPPNIVEKDKIRRIGEPLGVIMIGTYLKSKNFNVSIFDMTLEGYEDYRIEGDFVVYGLCYEKLLNHAFDFKPDIIGLSSMFSSKESLTLDAAKKLKFHFPSIPLVVGGMPPTQEPLKYLQSHHIDFVLQHDGERRLESLINILNPSFDLIRSGIVTAQDVFHGVAQNDLDGVVYLYQNDLKIIPAKKINAFFSCMQVPDRTLVNMDGYLKIGKPYAPFTQGRRAAHIVASKGCPFNCIFCAAVNFVGKKVHMRPVDNIIAEIKNVISNYNIQEVQFMDDNLTINYSFAVNLFNALIPLKIKWCTPNGLYFNSIDDALLKLMHESGCYQITLAIESGSQRVLRDVIQKNVNLSKVKHIVDAAHSLGMRVHGLFVVGLIGETRDELMSTLNFPFDNNFDSISISVANAFKGSRLYKICLEKGYTIKNSNSFNYKQSNFSIPVESSDYIMSHEDLESLVDETMERFYQYSLDKFPQFCQEKYDSFILASPNDRENVKHRI